MNKSLLTFSLLALLFGLSDCSKEEVNQIEPTSLDAQFLAGNTNIVAGTTVQFSDRSTGNPSEWQWTFEGGTPETSTEKNPVVAYLKPGSFKVTLRVADAEGESVETKMNYVTINPITAPPYEGTVWINPDIITSRDPNSFQSIEAKGNGTRTMYDRRVSNEVV